MSGLIAIARYVKARLAERSTWAGFGSVVAGAAAFASPYSWLLIAIGVVAMLVPEAGRHAVDHAETRS